MQHFAERLRAARKMSGLTLDALSKLLEGKVSKQTLNKYEQGLIKPEANLLLPLCTALTIRPDYFTRTKQVKISPPSFRKFQKLTAKEQAIAIERTRDHLERYLELEELMGIERKFKRDIQGIPDVIETPDHAETAAKAVRNIYSLGDDPLFNIIELLEDQGVIVVEIDAHEDFSGMSTYVDDRIPVIVLNGNVKNLDRKRFTTLHELAHLLLPIGNVDEKTEERLCDAFAGAMLLPEKKVIEMLGTHRSALIWNELVIIKELYGISVRAILYRARRFDIITDYDLTTKMAELGRTYGRKSEPGRYKGIEKAIHFRQLLLRAIAEEIITMSKAATLDGKKLADFRQDLLRENEDSDH